jgi:hypothetical protein
MPDVILQVRVIAEPDFEGHPPIRRYGPVDVGETVGALKAKLPKLVGTVGDERILPLNEISGRSTSATSMTNEKRRPAFPALAQVDDVWLVERLGKRGRVGAWLDFKPI